MSVTTGPGPGQKQRTFLGHPIGLYVLFFTEMWERFSYYGMRALLILYMVNFLKWSQKDASTIYKVYTSFVYVTPIIGGYLADRYLGNRIAVIIGAVLMAVGHFLMAFEEFPIFLSALIFLILGNGMFKPNMSVQVGRLYTASDGRRDAAYTIFYMGINLGAFLSPLVCGWLAENTLGGYHTGFTVAGIGMVAGLLIYLLGQPLIREIDPLTGAARVTGETPVAPEPVSTVENEEQRGLAGGSPHVTATPPAARALTPSDAITAQAPGQAAAQQPAAAGTFAGEALTEAQAASTPSVLGPFSKVLPPLLAVIGGLLLAAAPAMWFLERLDQWDAIMLGIGGFCMLLMAYVCAKVVGGMRDRVLAILVLGVFVMFFWAAFEQAGNVLNVWADKNTDRYLTQTAPPPQVVPEVAEEPAKAGEEEVARPGLFDRFRTMFVLKPRPSGQPQQTWGQWFASMFNPVPAAWFQSINALAIFLIAPLFAWMWLALDRKALQPSIPLKMTLGLLFMSASMAVMIGAANRENQQTTIAFRGPLPAGLIDQDGKVGHEDGGKFEPFHAGRLTYDAKSQTLAIYGVLPDNERDRIIEVAVPGSYREAVEELKKKSADIKFKSVSVKLDPVPPGFDMKFAGLKKSVVQFRPDDATLVAHQPLAEKEVKGLLVAGSDPNFRSTMNDLYVQSNKFQVSSWWLFWTYILATLGELCLSPVGLSMVSKLAPAKFATMLMGVWMLTSAFGNFAAGALGEIWGTIPPIQFFVLSTAVVGGSAIVLFVISRIVVATMHGVK